MDIYAFAAPGKEGRYRAQNSWTTNFSVNSFEGSRKGTGSKGQVECPGASLKIGLRNKQG